MPSLINHYYRFGEFTVDADQRVLLRQTARISGPGSLSNEYPDEPQANNREIVRLGKDGKSLNDEVVLERIGVGSITQSAETGGVAYMAHIGGFVAGLVLTFLFRGSRSTATA